MNASTFAARVCAATLSDMHSAIVAAIGTLKGPLHGGANEQVMRTLESHRPERASPRPYGQARRGEKIMGFGHRVYKTEDPRATHLRRMSQELAEASGDDTYYRMSKEMEEVVLETKGLYPNVDFYAATRLPLSRHPDRPVHPGLLGQPHGRMDGTRHRAARRQPAHPSGQRVHRRARPEVEADCRAMSRVRRAEDEPVNAQAARATEGRWGPYPLVVVGAVLAVVFAVVGRRA